MVVVNGVFKKIESIAEVLSSQPDYRVLRRFSPQRCYGRPPAGCPIEHGLFVDVETTGLAETDKIIQIGMVKFSFNPDGQILEVIEEFQGLEDPDMPISKEATSIHGLTNKDVKGYKIADDKVKGMLQGVSLVICHNAKFDRQMLERRFSGFDKLPWACSCAGVPWKDKFGSVGARLDDALAVCGLFSDQHHKALNDCHMGLYVLAMARDSRCSAFEYLLQSVREPQYTMHIEKPINDEQKAFLQSHGYKWVKLKGQWIGMRKRVDDEMDCVLEETAIHEYDPSLAEKVKVLTIGPLDRYSIRG